MDTALQAEITFLQEFRTRLITEVVTGKLDVRRVAASLPEQTESPEPVEEVGDFATSEDGDRDDLELEEAAA